MFTAIFYCVSKEVELNLKLKCCLKLENILKIFDEIVDSDFDESSFRNIIEQLRCDSVLASMVKGRSVALEKEQWQTWGL